MNRHDLTDEPWAVIQPLIPKQRPDPGCKRAHARRIVNGILFVQTLKRVAIV